jgi:hypothetical protein
MTKGNMITAISHRSVLIWFTILVIVGIGIIIVKFKQRSAEGIIVISGCETIVARDINIEELRKSSSVEAAQKLYYYYKFAAEDDKNSRKWHKEWNRRLAVANSGDDLK